MGQGRQAINMNALHNIYHHWSIKEKLLLPCKLVLLSLLSEAKAILENKDSS
jgi:hypothetical protein